MEDVSIADILNGIKNQGFLRVIIETVDSRDAKGFHIVEMNCIDLSGAGKVTLFNPTIQPVQGETLCISGTYPNCFAVKEFRGQKSINPSGKLKIWTTKDGRDKLPVVAAAAPAASPGISQPATSAPVQQANTEAIAAQFTVSANEIIKAINDGLGEICDGLNIIHKAISANTEILTSSAEQLKEILKGMVNAKTE